MDIIQHLKISVRLGLGFGFVLFLLACVAGLGLQRMAAVNGALEQSAGVAQVDQAMQQNAALVEEMAAAASSLKAQAGDLVEAVAVFKLKESDAVSARQRHDADIRALL